MCLCSYCYLWRNVLWMRKSKERFYWFSLKENSEPVRPVIKLGKCTLVNLNIVFSICRLNSEEEYVKGYIWQKQYNQLNSPVTLELIDSIRNDYLSTWDTREMVREKWVITVTGQLTLEVTGRKKMIWHERAVLNLSRFSRNSGRLTGAHWKYIDNGLCSKFVTRIKDSNNMLRGYLNGVGGGQCGQELGLFFSQ